MILAAIIRRPDVTCHAPSRGATQLRHGGALVHVSRRLLGTWNSCLGAILLGLLAEIP